MIMRLSIRYKLFLTLLLTTLVVVAGMYIFMQWSFERGFIRFVETQQQERIKRLIARLTDEYSRDKEWYLLRNNKRRWMQILRENRWQQKDRSRPWPGGNLRDSSNLWPPPRFAPPGPSKGRSHGPLELRLMLLDASKFLIFGRPEQVEQLALNPIHSNGRIVGYLGVLPGPALNQIGEVRFMEQQTESFVLIALIMVLASAVLAMLLAYTLIQPLKKVAEASKILAIGRYDIRIPVPSGDEVGQLAQNFNDLARALEKTERLRRQWVADISHELRTPLSLLRGELEALQDGVRPLS